MNKLFNYQDHYYCLNEKSFEECNDVKYFELNYHIDALNNYILAYDSAGKASSIVTIFMAPKYLDPHMTSETTSDVLRDNELLSVKTYQTTKIEK